MAFMSDYQQRQLRDGELRRFDRWFVDTAMGPAYRARDGRARHVKAEEVARWRGDVEAYVDAMIASVPMHAAWAVGALLVVVFGGGWLLDLLEIEQRFHAPAIGLGAFVVEVGLVGIEIWDYVEGWRRRRDAIEDAVRARAPLPIDPARIGSGRNWYQIAMVALIGTMVLAAYAVHVDEDILAGGAAALYLLGVPLVWGLHFAAKWHDRRAGRVRD